MKTNKYVGAGCLAWRLHCHLQPFQAVMAVVRDLTSLFLSARTGLVLTLAWLMAVVPAIRAQETVPAPANLSQTNSEVIESYKKMSLEELMNQEVTSVSKTPEKLADAPAAIQVVTSEDIQRSGAQTLPEALRLADNLDVAQVNSHDWAISARGFNANLANKLLVLIDGRAVYSPLYGGVLWNMQDYLMNDIDRIEVISGPGGTLWGANAVNGVINITTKNAKDTQGLYVEAGGGNELQDLFGARYGGMLSSNVYYRVYGKYFNLGSEELSNGGDAPDKGEKGQGGFRIDTEPSLPNVFTLQGDFYAGNEDIYAGDERIGGGNVLGRWTRTISDDAAASLQTYFDQTYLTYPYGGTLGTLGDALSTYDIDFQNNFGLGARNKIVWGLGYRFTHEVEQEAHQVLFLPPTLNHNLFSGFLQDEIQLRENLFLTLGSKLEHNDYTGFEVEPSGRLQWNVTDHQMIWGAISRAVRTPSRFDHDLIIPTFLPPPYQTFQEGNPDFESETLIAFELGYRAQLNRRISGSLSTFFNDYNDLRSLTPGPAADFYLPHYFQNNLEGYTWGAELSVDYQVLDWWRLHAGYDFLKENIHVKPGQVDLDNALYETADPQSQVFLRSSMDLPWHLSLDLDSRWIDELHTDNGATPGTVPSYFELNARLAWQATKHLEFSITGENLLHDKHVEYGFPDATQEQIVRNIFGKVTWRF